MFAILSRALRLICSIQAVVVTLALLVAWPATASVKWEVRQITDAMTDVQTATAAVRKRGCCALHVGFSDIGLAFSPLMRFDAAKGPLLPKLELRVDRQPSWTFEGEVASNRTLLIDKAKGLPDLLRQMGAGSVLRIRYWTQSSGSSIVELPLTNAYRSLQSVEQAAMRKSADTVKNLADAGIPYQPIFPIAKPKAAATAQAPAPVAEKPAARPAGSAKRFAAMLQQAQAGDRDAQYWLAKLYGPPVNRISAQEAYAYLEQSAEAGNLHALAEKGFRQFMGQGTASDNEGGVATLEMAGKSGHPRGYFVLGAIYDGQAREHVAPDHAKASQYYEACIGLLDNAAIKEKAANFYIRQCLTSLGRHYLQGKGARKDLYRARALFQQAADMGEPIGMTYLAFRMLSGEGGSKDRDGAIAWLQKSKATGNKVAAKALAELGVTRSSAASSSKPDAKQARADRKKRPKYIMYAFMARANERERLQKFKPGHVNIFSGNLAGRPESEIFHGMLLQNNDFLQEKFIGPNTPFGFENRGEMRNAMVDSYDPNDPYKPMRVTPVGHQIMDALATHMKLDDLVETVALNANKRRNR